MDGSSERRAARRRPRVAVVALGCRVNRADADALAGELSGRFDLAPGGEAAELVVVNTCSVTADADSAARQAIRRAARDHPGARIVAAGCYAELRPEELRALPGVCAVVGVRAHGAVAAILAGLDGAEGGRGGGGRGAAGGGRWGPAPSGPARHTRPFLKVQDGCDRRCSYCVVPLARGPSRSLPFEEAVRRIALLGRRHPEVVLTGIHLGGFGRDLVPRRTLGELVLAAARARAVRRIRLSSIEPDELPREILRDGQARGALCEHFHLPLQSGSPRILAAMRRPASPGAFRRAVEEILSALPEACIGTDVIAGFPGETEEDHRRTVAAVEEMPLAYLHVFPFSPRPGTAADSLPGRLPPAAVRERVQELLAISQRKWSAFLRAQVGRELEVVVERVEGGVARGTAREWVTVRWPASDEARGDVIRVRVQGADGVACRGVRAGALAP